MLNICIHCEFERGNFDRSSFEHSKFGLIEGEGCRNIGTGQLAVTTLKHCPIGSIYIAPVVTPPSPFISNPMLLLLLLFHARCSQSFQYFASRANSWPSAWAKPWCPEARPQSTLASQAGWTGVDDASTCPPAPKTGQNTSLSNMRDSQTNKLHIDVAVCDLLYQN